MAVVRDYLYYYPDHWVLGESKIAKRKSQCSAANSQTETRGFHND